MLKYKIVTSTVLALLVAGCGVNNDNTDNGRRNVSYNPRNTEAPNAPLNVNDVNNNRANDTRLNDVNNNRADNRLNGVNNRTNDTRLNNVNNRTFNDNDFTLSDKIANRVTGLKEVKSANVLITNHTAYVAATLNPNQKGRVSTKIEKKIANTVRHTDTSIDRVYVSTNPNFVNRVNQYAQDVGNGRPVQGFGQQFGELVNRIFPNAR